MNLKLRHFLPLVLLVALPSVATAATAAEKKLLLDKVQAARRSAIQAIFDEQLYPDANHGASGQPEVDKRVKKVRDAYAAFEPVLKADVSVLAHKPLAERKAFLAKADSKLTPWQRAVKRRYLDDRIGRANAALPNATELPTHGVRPTALEVEQAKITNAYRMLMGRKALRLTARLVNCARKHSKEMVALNYFSHGSPVAKNDTLVERFAQVDLHPTSMGENILWGSGPLGTPQATQDGFYNSSGHHRNLLRATWVRFGIGRAVKSDPQLGEVPYWTQDYSN
ncbi:MAG: CAP domain-containing protein [Planctomycetota bacterium]